MKMSAVDKLAYLLVVIGGLNWGLVGFFKYNLVDELFGVESGISRVVYALVGLAALWMLLSLAKVLGGGADK